jgi:hypothetical protein
MKNRLFKIVSVVFLLAIAAPNSYTQCPMCKIGVESNLRNGGSAGNGLNVGILYILAMPYLLVGTLGLIWYKNRKDENEIPDA